MSTLFLPLERTAPEGQAIIDAARAYVEAEQAVDALGVCAWNDPAWQTAEQAAEQAYQALRAAVNGPTPEEATHVG